MTRKTTMTNQELFDYLLRHQIYLLKYSDSLSKRIMVILDETEAEISDRIKSRKTGLDSLADYRKAEDLLRIIKKIRMVAWDKITALVFEELTQLAKQEPEVFKEEEFSIPTASLLAALVASRHFQGKTVRQWTRTLAQQDIQRIDTIVRAGMVASEPTTKISRNIFGAGGVAETTRKQTTSIIKTLVSFIASEARHETIKNAVTKERYTAVLDAKTTAVCRSIDGKIYDVGVGPRPPLHFNCRSIRIPILAGEEFTGRPTYEEWLRTQSKQFQEEALGKKKAKLFREEGLTLDKFVSPTGKELTLKQLAAK